MLKERIKDLRLQYHLTQKELSDKLGLTPKMVSFYELGERVPPPDVLQNLADIFDVSTDYLLSRTDRVLCKDCHYMYNPLSKSDVGQHSKYHNKYISAKNNYGLANIPSYLDAEIARNKALQQIRKKNIIRSERLKAYVEFIHAEYVIMLWKNNLSLDCESFSTFMQKDIGLASTKTMFDEVEPGFYDYLVEQYGALSDENAHDSPGDDSTMEIGNDLDKIIRKIESVNDGMLLYHGEPLESDSIIMLKNALELGIRQLKTIPQ